MIPRVRGSVKAGNRLGSRGSEWQFVLNACEHFGNLDDVQFLTQVLSRLREQGDNSEACEGVYC